MVDVKEHVMARLDQQPVHLPGHTLILIGMTDKNSAHPGPPHPPLASHGLRVTYGHQDTATRTREPHGVPGLDHADQLTARLGSQRVTDIVDGVKGDSGLIPLARAHSSCGASRWTMLLAGLHLVAPFRRTTA